MTSPIATPQQVARELAQKIVGDGPRWKGQISDLDIELLIDRITTALEATAKSAREAEREACKRDVCTYCGGRGPTHETSVVKGPAGSGNFVHEPTKDYASSGGGQRLCDATAIFSRERYEAAIATEPEQENQNHGR